MERSIQRKWLHMTCSLLTDLSLEKLRMVLAVTAEVKQLEISTSLRLLDRSRWLSIRSAKPSSLSCCSEKDSGPREMLR